jgi:hypothetical protein
MVRGVVGGADRKKPMRVTVGVQDHAGQWHKLVYRALRDDSSALLTVRTTEKRKGRLRRPQLLLAGAVCRVGLTPTGKRRLCTTHTQSRRWMFGRIFGSDGRESYRELRLDVTYYVALPSFWRTTASPPAKRWRA